MFKILILVHGGISAAGIAAAAWQRRLQAPWQQHGVGGSGSLEAARHRQLGDVGSSVAAAAAAAAAASAVPPDAAVVMKTSAATALGLVI
jgi:hypothetical protein